MGKSNRPEFPDITNRVGSFFSFMFGLMNMQYQLNVVAIPSEIKTEFSCPVHCQECGGGLFFQLTPSATQIYLYVLQQKSFT